MKIDKKYIVIAVCILIGGVLTATLAFIGPDIITNGTINPNNVVTGNLKLKITDTSVNINNMAPIRSSNYETEAFKKEFTISNAESTLNGCMKLYLNFNSISDTLKSEYLVYKVVSSTGNVSEGSFKDIADNKLLIYDSDFIETNKSITYTLYIWLRYVEDPTINLASLLGTSVNAYVSVNGSDTKESTSCTFDSSKKISYVVTFMNTDNKTVLESRKVSSGSVLGNLPDTKGYYTLKNAKGDQYTSVSTVNNDLILYPGAKVTYCTYSGTPTQGTEFVNGSYTYHYKQEANGASSWSNISSDGWGVMLTNKTSTAAVTSDVCTYINNVPVVSMSYMYFQSKATTLNTYYDTSNVTSMEEMFSGSSVKSLDLSLFNTSKVTTMYRMFYITNSLKTLDVSNFDTSNVEGSLGMIMMFRSCAATKLDLSSFNTSKVTNMSNMFYGSKATEINVENFDTSNVTSMSYMFYNSQATTLDLSSFELKSGVDITSMFENAKATKGYAKNSTIASSFNSTSNIPSTLVFTVK